MCKKIIAILLAMLIILSIAGCGRLDEDGVYYMVSTWAKDEKAIKNTLKNTARTVDPQQVYASITYNEKLFYGDYRLKNWDKSKKDFVKNATFADLDYSVTYLTNESQLKTEKLSTMPVGFSAGAPCLYETRGNRDHEWALLTLATESGTTRDILCTYTVEGSTIRFTPLDSYTALYDENYKRLGFEYALGQDSLAYTFAFSGVELTLSNGEQSVTLFAEDFSDNGHSTINIGGYLSEDSPSLEGIDWISASLSNDYQSVYVTLQDETAVRTTNEAIAMTEDGWMAISWTNVDEEGNTTDFSKQFVYFIGDGSVMTLTDGTNFYYYTDNYFTREMNSLSGLVAEDDQGQLSSMEEEELKEIAEKKNNLLTDLAAAYQNAGLNVSVNTQTGEIALDSTVLFGVNESDISADGKAFLKKFIEVYTAIVFSDKYDNFISTIMVEGHTDTNGGYDMNLSLSQARADSVKSYCLSEECGAYVDSLKDMMQAIGYSYDKPIYKDNGEVDMDASRRVSFRFLVNLNAEG